MNIQEKEQLIIGTILECNSEIKKLSESTTFLKLPGNNNIYHYNMVNLLGEIMNVPGTNLNESVQIPVVSHIKNNRNNNYAYFQKVYEFLDGFEVSLQNNLNESLKVDGNINGPGSTLDISTFKQDLKEIIKQLQKNDDLNYLSKDILKIKILARKPIYVYGYNILNNGGIQQELFEKFNLTNEKLISILFDKSNKQILFISNAPNTTVDIVVYDLKQDRLDRYNIINSSEQIPSKKLEIKTYLQTLKELTGNNNYIELYINIEMLQLKFTDNLYSDGSRTVHLQEVMKNSSVVKK